MVCLILCLLCRASISRGRVTSSLGSVSSQEGRGGRLSTRLLRKAVKSAGQKKKKSTQEAMKPFNKHEWMQPFCTYLRSYCTTQIMSWFRHKAESKSFYSITFLVGILIATNKILSKLLLSADETSAGLVNILPVSTGASRSSSLHNSSLNAWFLCRRPGVRPHMGLSTGRATSTSWVISANRITSCTDRTRLTSDYTKFTEMWGGKKQISKSLGK